jgi:myo-inositol 2-dehydrogenase/D-chiro-inositol 1-dehydrogenase
MGCEHAAILAGMPEVQVVAIADPDPRALAAGLALCPEAQGAGDGLALVARPDLDAVLVCSPTDTHAGLVERAAGAGKHVFCEKPVDLDLQRVKDAVAAARRAGVKLQVGFNRRFDPQFRRVARAVRNGVVGQPHLLRITSRDPEPPSLEYARTSGGIFLDMSIHDLDMARFLAGDEVVEVSAFGSTLVEPGLAALGDVDTALITLRFRNGALCAIDNSRRAVYGYDQRVEVFGSEGCLVGGDGLPSAAAADGARASGTAPGFFLERYHASYVAEMQAFVRCLRDGSAAEVDGQDGVAATVLAVAAQRSLVEGRPVAVTPDLAI